MDGERKPEVVAQPDPFAVFQIIEKLHKPQTGPKSIRPFLALEKGGKEVMLTDTEFRLYAHLRKAKGAYVPTRVLLDTLYETKDDEEEGSLTEDKTLERHISNLRKKIESLQEGSPRFTIRIWYAMGYYLNDEEHPSPYYGEDYPNKK